METTARVGARSGVRRHVRHRRDADLPDPAPRRRRCRASMRSWPTPARCRTRTIVERTEHVLDGRFATIRTSPRWSARSSWQDDRIVTTVGFLLVPGLHLLDLAGPAQVFSTAADFGHGYPLTYVAEHGRRADGPGPHRARGDRTCRRSPLTDLLMVPGWRSPDALRGTGRLADRDASTGCQRHHRAGGTVASVCSGPTLARPGRAARRRAAAPPTTTCRTNWPGATCGRRWCATCSMSSTAGWSPRPASPAASTSPCT